MSPEYKLFFGLFELVYPQMESIVYDIYDCVFCSAGFCHRFNRALTASGVE